MRVRSGTLLLAVALLAGCLSIPVSTLWKLRNFTIDQFLALDPAALRAAVRTDSRASYGEVALQVTAEWKGQPPQRFDLVLKPESAPDSRLDPAPPGRRWHVFALGPDGTREFDAFRRSLGASRQTDGTIAIGISLRASDAPSNIARALPVRVDLLLDRKDGYFTLMSESIVDTARFKDETLDKKKTN